MLKSDKDVIADFHKNTGIRVAINEHRTEKSYVVPYEFYDYLIENTIENINNKVDDTRTTD